MKCAMCGRPLALPTVAIPTRAGPMAYGPKCAKRAGLVRHKERKPKRTRFISVSAVDKRQTDWVQQAQQGVA